MGAIPLLAQLRSKYMKREDFSELIDLKAEYKEYARFDKGKSTIYKTYAEWDAHMESLLVAIKSPTDIYNLKRYCVDKIRSNNNSAQIILAYISLAIPLALAFATEQDIIGIRGWVNGGIMLACLGCFLFSSNTMARKKHFFEDILRIIEQIENQS